MGNVISILARIAAILAVVFIFLIGNDKFHEKYLSNSQYFKSPESTSTKNKINEATSTPVEIIPIAQPAEQSTTTSLIASSTSIVLSTTTSTKPKSVKPASKTSLSDVEKNLITAKKLVDQFSIDINQTIPEEKQYTIPEINKLTRDALVNILCTTTYGGALRPITGTGIIIDDRGVILTNSHIAQYFLLRDFPSKDNIICTIRTGSPAVAHYYARPIFVSHPWIETNAKDITSQNPMGTGEYDFALLAITDLVNKSETMPSTFPSVSMDTKGLSENTVTKGSYVAGAYPAGFLGGTAVQKDLFANSAVVNVKGIYTFDKNTIDLISVGGSVIAQKGSSGGGVVRISDGKLVGIVVTTTDEKETGDRDLRAITTDYINRSLEMQTGRNVTQYLAGNIGEKVVAFEKNELPYLKALLTTVLGR